jgi:hypothetical protein
MANRGLAVERQPYAQERLLAGVIGLFGGQPQPSGEPEQFGSAACLEIDHHQPICIATLRGRSCGVHGVYAHCHALSTAKDLETLKAIYATEPVRNCSAESLA